MGVATPQQGEAWGVATAIANNDASKPFSRCCQHVCFFLIPVPMSASRAAPRPTAAAPLPSPPCGWSTPPPCPPGRSATRPTPPPCPTPPGAGRCTPTSWRSPSPTPASCTPAPGVGNTHTEGHPERWNQTNHHPNFHPWTHDGSRHRWRELPNFFCKFGYLFTTPLIFSGKNWRGHGRIPACSPMKRAPPSREPVDPRPIPC